MCVSFQQQVVSLKVDLCFMDPEKNSSARTPFGDLTNTTNAGSQSVSNSRIQVDDPMERKRRRERARRAAMTKEQKVEINRKQRENYHKRKAQAMLVRESEDDALTTCQPINNIVDDGSVVDLTNKTPQPSPGVTRPVQIVGTSFSSNDMHKVDCVTPTPYAVKPCTPISSRSQYLSEWYKNMTPEQREARLERQRLHNTLPGRKQAKKISKERLKEVRKNTLHQESIAMENPIYVPELVWPTIEVSEPHGTTPTIGESLIPKVMETPLYIPPDSVEMMEMDKDGCNDIYTTLPSDT
ncbi:uncharacterized protein [Miscanthus floridulus]|uniref:uncharacterized protein n=1 Tax=Miscanthus floridulus TaxID=154761 RepID=UPI003459CE78